MRRRPDGRDRASDEPAGNVCVQRAARRAGRYTRTRGPARCVGGEDQARGDECAEPRRDATSAATASARSPIPEQPRNYRTSAEQGRWRRAEQHGSCTPKLRRGPEHEGLRRAVQLSTRSASERAILLDVNPRAPLERTGRYESRPAAPATTPTRFGAPQDLSLGEPSAPTGSRARVGDHTWPRRTCESRGDRRRAAEQDLAAEIARDAPERTGAGGPPRRAARAQPRHRLVGELRRTRRSDVEPPQAVERTYSTWCAAGGDSIESKDRYTKGTPSGSPPSGARSPLGG